MTCKHPVIQTWKYEDGEPATWSCVDCRHKFVPFSQMLQEVADEREACAALAEQTVCDTHLPTGVKIYGTRAAKVIRARGQE
jgi:hypothetical protein